MKPICAGKRISSIFICPPSIIEGGIFILQKQLLSKEPDFAKIAAILAPFIILGAVLVAFLMAAAGAHNTEFPAESIKEEQRQADIQIANKWMEKGNYTDDQKSQLQQRGIILSHGLLETLRLFFNIPIEKAAEILSPTDVKFQTMYIVTTVSKSDGGHSESKQPVSKLISAKTYNGTHRFSYRMNSVSTTTEETRTYTRQKESSESDNGITGETEEVTETITVTTTVSSPVLENDNWTADYTPLNKILVPEGIRTIEDRKLIYKQTIVFDPLFRDPEAEGLGLVGPGGFGPGGVISDVGLSAIPAEFLPLYKEAESAYGVPWNLLAGIHRVETSFSTDVSESSAGAIGHMQFMPCTWVGWGHPTCKGLGKGNIPLNELKSLSVISQYKGYGVDADGDGLADPWSVKDAIFSAAKYLAANGAASGKLDQAVKAYNHSQEYVDKVLTFANSFIQGNSVPVSIDGTVWPLPQGEYITSKYRIRWGKMHTGIDLAAGGDSTGKTIVAFSKGVVTYSGVKGGYGNCIIIDHGGGMTTLYGHMLQPGIAAGTQVQPGTPIGLVGDTGNSNGAHLHFEVRLNDTPVDPLPYVIGFKPKILDNVSRD